MQNFRMTNKEHYGMLLYFLERSIVLICTSKKNKLNDSCSCTKMTSPSTSPSSSFALLNPLQKLLVNIFRVTRTTKLLELKAVMECYVSCFQNAVTSTNLKARENVYYIFHKPSKHDN